MSQREQGEVVEKKHMTRSMEHFFDPPSVHTKRLKMVHGVLKWKFHLKALSRNLVSTLQNKEFTFRIRCVNPELDRYDLETQSDSFIVVSRAPKLKS